MRNFVMIIISLIIWDGFQLGVTLIVPILRVPLYIQSCDGFFLDPGRYRLFCTPIVEIRIKKHARIECNWIRRD